MGRDFLVYWPWKLVQDEFAVVGILVHDNSGKFAQRHVTTGDTLWYVTIPRLPSGELSGKLYLFGRLHVAQIWTDHQAVQRYLEQQYAIQWLVRDDTTNPYHVTAIEGTGQPYELVKADHLASALRFEGEHNQLSVEDGRVVNLQELQALRLLTPASVQLLAALWDAQHIACIPPITSPQSVSESAEPEDLAAVPPIDDVGFPEGAVAERRHLARERNRQLVRNAKRLFKEVHGRLFCQVCGFDFSERYGDLGQDYIEAHHTLPVSEMDDGHLTHLDDLAMVCANCHRMLHRRRPWLAMHELQRLLTDAAVTAISVHQ